MTDRTSRAAGEDAVSSATSEDAGRASVLDAGRSIVAESQQADGFDPVSDQALIAARQGRRQVFGFTRGHDGHDCDKHGGDAAGELAGFGILGEGELDLVVRPAARGRGIGSTALRRMLAQADAEVAAEAGATLGSSSGSGSGTGELRAWAHGENPAARALLERAGFVPVRSLLRMTLDPVLLDAAIATARPLPEGFEVRAYDPANAHDAAEWVRVNAAAFAHHPEQGAMTLDDFHALAREPWFDAADLRLAFPAARGDAASDGQGCATDGGQGDATDGDAAPPLAGFAWVKTVPLAGGSGTAPISESAGVETELYVLGVDPVHAGIGLGAALLGETLRRMKTHDPSDVSLYVDGDNAAALPLYERAGFVVAQRSTQYARKNA